MSLAALQHVESSLTRDQICVPYIGRQVLNHWAAREVPIWNSCSLFLFPFAPHHLIRRMGIFPSLFLPLLCSVSDIEDGYRNSQKLVTTPEPLLGVCPFLGSRCKEITVQQKKIYIYINQKLVIIQNSFFLIEDGDPQGTSRTISIPASLSDKINSSYGWKESGNMKEKKHILGEQVSGISVWKKNFPSLQED